MQSRQERSVSYILRDITAKIDNPRERKHIRHTLGFALKAIDVYLLDIREKDETANAPYRNLLSLFNKHQILCNKVVEVFEKLGQAKLKAILYCENPIQELHVSLLEKIGHYFNKLIRAVTCGYIGYEFSTLEAKEAIRTGFDHNYQAYQKDWFTDNNTRFAQVINRVQEINLIDLESCKYNSESKNNSVRKMLSADDIKIEVVQPKIELQVTDHSHEQDKIQGAQSQRNNNTEKIQEFIGYQRSKTSSYALDHNR